MGAVSLLGWDECDPGWKEGWDKPLEYPSALESGRRPEDIEKKLHHLPCFIPERSKCSGGMLAAALLLALPSCSPRH